MTRGITQALVVRLAKTKSNVKVKVKKYSH
jgi:hypothetical protein